MKCLVAFAHVNKQQVRKLGSGVIISVAARKLERAVDNHLYIDSRLCSVNMNRVALRGKKISM